MKTPTRFEFYAASDPRARGCSRWVAERIPGCARGWDDCVALCVMREDVIGCVLFHDWNPENGTMSMSAAGSDGWLTRRVLYAMHNYVFNDAGCRLAVLQTSERNAVMRRIALSYGYSETLIPRLRGRDEAEAVLTLQDDEWRSSRFHKRQINGQA